MTRRHALLNTLRREGNYGIHGDIGLTPPKLKEFRKRRPMQTVAGYFGLSHRNTTCFYKPTYKGDGKHLFAGKDVPENLTVDAFGVGTSKGSEAAMHMVRYHCPLEGNDTTLEQVKNHPLPRFIPALAPLLRIYVGLIHLRGLASFGIMEQTIWERAWLIRGMNDLMMDMMSDDPKAAALLDKLTDHACRSAYLLSRTGHDIIALGDDIGMQSTLMMSPELWRKWLKPRLAKVIRTIKSTNPEVLVFYHSCGFVEPIIGDLVEIGVEILNPVQPESMDFRKIHAEYGNRLSFWGGIGTQTTFPFGSPDEVRARVKELSQISGDNGGIVMAPTHVIEPEVSWENLEAYREIVRDR